MKSIHKYVLSKAAWQIVHIPRGARILSAQIQRGAICLWALIDTEQPTVATDFEIRGTGIEFNGEDGEYIGTVQDGSFVWHVFRTGVGEPRTHGACQPAKDGSISGENAATAEPASRGR